MTYKFSPGLAADAQNARRTALNGGRLYVFAGPEPDNANDALDLTVGTGLHTQCVEYTLNGAGTTGLTFATTTNDVLNKTPAEAWRGLVDFVGAQQASSTLTPTFFRFCAAGDNGRAAGTSTSKRWQGSVSGPNGNGDLVIGSDTLTDNGVNTESIAGMVLRELIGG